MNKISEFLKKHRKTIIKVSLVLFIFYTVFDACYFVKSKPETYQYTEFKQMVEDGKIDTVYYNNSQETMRFTMYNDYTKDKTEKELEKENYQYPIEDWGMTTYPATETFREDLLAKGVNVKIKSFRPAIISIMEFLGYVAFPLLLIIILVFYFKMFLGKDGKAFELSDGIETRFSDVIGHDEVIKDLNLLVDVMKNPDKYERSNGVKVPKGILFSGEPGTGKTLLARAMAGESDVPFYYMNASNFIELYVGTGAKRVRALFKEARKNQPCIVFVDEIDAIGMSRNRANISSEDTQTLNALLQELDGFKTGDKILVIGATNNADKLDKALTRSGRFDRQIIISPPRDTKTRIELLKYFTKDKKLSDDVSFERLAKQMIGYTGADINSVVNEAGLISMSKDKEYIDMSDLEEAYDKKILKGNRKKRDKDDKDLMTVAYHEAGHAVVSYLLGSEIARASIIGTTSGVGGMVVNVDDDTVFLTDEKIKRQVMVAYGGRCSESIKFGEVTNGASSDITQATKLLKIYVTKYGFDGEFGLIDYDVLIQDNIMSTDIVLDKVTKLSKKLAEDTMTLLKDNYKLVEVLANELLDKETISGDAIKEILDNEK